MPTVFVDEPGHTGHDLLNPDQPIFALATHDFEEAEARQVKMEFFGFSNARSLKFSNLSRNMKGQQAVLSFLEEMTKRSDRFAVLAIHKPFALICKLVDHVVETSM